MTTFWRAFHHDGKNTMHGKDGWGTPPPFTIMYCTVSTFAYKVLVYKVLVYVPAERADTVTLFLLYPYPYSVVQSPSCILCLSVFIWGLFCLVLLVDYRNQLNRHPRGILHTTICFLHDTDHKAYIVKKRLAIFQSPAGMSLTKLSLDPGEFG